jgi:formate dehydrogenase iron-sulfur subunit
VSEVIEKRVVTNLDRCVECGSCGAACHASHAQMPVVRFAQSGFALLPLICRQCKAASCVEACPAEAMVRDEKGVVKRLFFRCIGCGSCARGCPFGVIFEDLSGVPSNIRSTDRVNGHQAAKCDLCADRTECDAEAVPRCVAACPTGALLYMDEHQAEEMGVEMLGGRTTGENPYRRR